MYDVNQNLNSCALVFIKAIGESPAHFFAKINFGFYMKVLSTNYKPVFIE